MDPRFGRCRYFIIVDLATSQFEAFENPNVDAGRGAGIQSAQFVAGKGIEAVLTGRVGPKAFHTLDSADISIITDFEGSVKEAIEKYRESKVFRTGEKKAKMRE
jgi:predicted Fe-Mo cluster-binding NifX family protein